MPISFNCTPSDVSFYLQSSNSKSRKLNKRSNLTFLPVRKTLLKWRGSLFEVNTKEYTENRPHLIYSDIEIDRAGMSKGTLLNIDFIHWSRRVFLDGASSYVVLQLTLFTRPVLLIK